MNFDIYLNGTELIGLIQLCVWSHTFFAFFLSKDFESEMGSKSTIIVTIGCLIQKSTKFSIGLEIQEGKRQGSILRGNYIDFVVSNIILISLRFVKFT